jgi:hypothetical protein
MNALEEALRRVTGDLQRERRRWALVGGFAVSARAEPRFTRDIDIVVAVADDADGEALARCLIADGYQLIASVEQDEALGVVTPGHCPGGTTPILWAETRSRLCGAHGCWRHPPPLAKKLLLLNSSWVR